MQPPLCNTGVSSEPGGETPRYFASLDWIRFSIPIDMPLQAPFPEDYPIYPTGEVIKPRYGYKQTAKFNVGACFWSDDHPEFRRSYDFSGSELAELVSLGADLNHMLRKAIHCSGKFSRLDLALDIWDDPRAKARSFFAHWVSGDILTTARKGRMIGDTEKRPQSGELTPVSLGDTCYIGSRSSERSLRVYDKALQLDMPDQLWCRMELELKDRVATIAAAEILVHGVAPITSAHLNCMIRSGVPWIKDALNAYPDPGLPPVGEKLTDWETWVVTVALPAVKKAYYIGLPEVLRAIDGLKPPN